MTERMTSKEFRELQCKQQTKSKHRNRPTVYRGIRYDSVLEAQFAERLDYFKERGCIKSWTRQVPFWVHSRNPDVPSFCHRVDFLVFLGPDETARLIEVKGRDLPEGRIKREMVERFHGLPIQVITKTNINTWHP